MRMSWSTPGGSVDRGLGAPVVVVVLALGVPVDDGSTVGSGSVPQPDRPSRTTATTTGNIRFTAETLLVAV
jgi:hypothetical protein